jgi:hypothetical protein
MANTHFLITNQLLYHLSYAGENARQSSASGSPEQARSRYSREPDLIKSSSVVSSFG